MIHWARTHNGLSFFPPVLIFLRQKAASEVAQLHLRVLNLPTIHILYTPPPTAPYPASPYSFSPSSFLSGISHLFLINPLYLHYLLGPTRLFSRRRSLLSFPSLHNVRHSTSAIIHVLTIFFFPLVALQSGRWAIFGPADD